MAAALKLSLPLVRFPEVTECTHEGQGKCQNFACRYSALEGWSRIEQWDAEDRAELVDALPDTCALGLAAMGGMSIEEIATFLGVPRDVIERTESVALRRLHMHRDLRRTHREGA